MQSTSRWLKSLRGFGRLALLLPLTLCVISATGEAQETKLTPEDLRKSIAALPVDAYPERIQLGRSLLEALELAPDGKAQLQAHYELGTWYLRSEEFGYAEEQFGAGADLAEQLEDKTFRLRCIAEQVEALDMLGELESALELGAVGIGLAAELELPRFELRLHNHAGIVHNRRAEYGQALASYKRGLVVAERLGAQVPLAQILNNIGISYNSLGQPGAAIDFLDRALQIGEEQNDALMQSQSLANLATSLTKQGEYEEALVLLQESRDLFGDSMPRHLQALSHNSFSFVYMNMGDFDKVIQHSKQALAITEELNLPSESILALLYLSEAYAAQDRGSEAVSLAEQSLEIPAIIERKEVWKGALQTLAKAHVAAGDLKQAQRVRAQASDVELEIQSLADKQEFAEVHQKFEVEKRERKIALLEKDNEIQRLELARQGLLRNSLLIGSGLLLIIASVGWSSYLRKRRADRALQASQRHYQTLCNLSPVGFFRTDTKGNFNYVNQRWSEITGLLQEEAYGSDWKSAIHEDDRQRVELEWSQSVASSAPFQCNYRIKSTQGITCSVLSQALPEFDLNSEVTGYVGTITDISAQQKMEENVREAQKLSGIGMLAGGIAHDFNNILASIMGNASLADEDLSADSPGKDNLKAIMGASERAADLCSQLLAYAGKGRFEMEALDINAAVNEMSDLLRVSLGPLVTMHLDLDAGLLCAQGDATQIRQVILNLLTNALEALEDEAGSITLTTRNAERLPPNPAHSFLLPENHGEKFTVISVEDDGCGFEAETCLQMFDPFFTTKVSGHGLGMAAVLGIVRAHHGAICMRSRPSVGTCIEIYLPATPKPLTITPAPGAAQTPGASAKTVLIVDDNEAIRSIAAEILKRSGYRVLSAEDGRDALHVFDKSAARVDLVLLDVIMPNMDGVEAFFELRRRQIDLPIIMTSGYTEEDSMGRLEGQARQAVRFLKKPYKPGDLAAMVHSMTKASSGTPKETKPSPAADRNKT